MIEHKKFELVVNHLRATFPIQNTPFNVRFNVGTTTAQIGLGSEMAHAVNVDQLGGMSVEGIVCLIADMFPIDAAYQAKRGAEKAMAEYAASKRDIMSPAHCREDGWTGD
jgi:hypothetical protein